MKKVLLVFLVVLFCGSTFAFPQLLPVQGKLKGNNAGDVNKQLPMTFSFYSTAIGGTAFWAETRYVDVNITDIDENIGVFSVLLGDTAWLDLNSHSDWNYLGIKIQNNTEMLPRIRLGAAAYSFISYKALSLDLSWLYGVDLNSGLQPKVDLNANWYGKLDVNNQFVPYNGAIADVNLNDKNFMTTGKIIAGDSNFASVTATNYFGRCDDLIGIPKDINAHFVPFISATASINILSDLNISKSVNKGVSISSDANRICFPSNSCEMMIDFNGTAFTFGS